MDAKARFNELRGELRLPLADLARLLRIGYGTAKAYAAAGNTLQPPATLLETMEQVALAAAVHRIRTAGLEVIPRRKAA